MKKNGFTLIELLAVIVILAIIALIATPIVLNIIEDSKKSAFEQTANGIIKAAEYYYMKEMSDGEKTTQNKVFTFDESTNVISGLEFDGDVPKKGQIMITENGKVSMSISNGEYCITKLVNEEKLIFSESNEECAFPDAVNGIMSSKDYCIVSGKCKNGTLVTVQVNDTEKHDFYVIKDTNSELRLIMNDNLYVENQLDVVKWSYSEKNSLGPDNALDILEIRTKEWKNVSEREYVISDDSGSNKYVDIVRTMKATMPTKTEVENIAKENDGVVPEYLYENVYGKIHNYAYWFSTADSSDNNHACYMQSSGRISCYRTVGYADSTTRIAGIRPVITLSK